MSTSRFLAAGLITLALAAGCGKTASGTAAPASAGAAAATTAASTTDAVGWVDKFCGAMVDFQKSAQKQPQIDPSSPTNAIAGLRSYISDFTAAIDKAVADLKADGPSPTPSGDAAVTALTKYLTSARAAFAKAGTSLDAASTSDPTSITDAVAPLASLENPPDPLKDLSSDPQLDAAAAQAPNCKKLDASS